MKLTATLIVSVTLLLLVTEGATVLKGRTINYGYKLSKTEGVSDPAECEQLCIDYVSKPKNHNCEAWNFHIKKGVCTLMQLTGWGEIGPLGDLSGISWKRHSNFRGDCTPLWVNTAGKKEKTIKTTGVQYKRDVACCEACADDPQCEVWSQGTDWDDKGYATCTLKTISKEQTGASFGVLGAGDADMDSHERKPKPYFSERRNVVCSDVKDRVVCGPPNADASTCQAYGCCVDGASGACFKSKWRPVVIMHGMGSRLVEYEKNIRWLRLAYPGIYVKNMNIYPGPPSQMTLMAPQMARVQQAIRADPMMKDGFNFYGESQGGLIARAYVSEFNAPPVYNLVAISGPQSGVGLCPEVDMPVIKQICSGGAPIIGVYDWPRCSFCDFWKGKKQKRVHFP